MRGKKNIPFLVWLGLALLLFQLFYLTPESSRLADVDVITGDGRGYYDYLTSIFIDHDLSDQPINGRFIVDHEGKGLNKYFSGTAFLMLPFFLIGLVIAALAGAPLDGFSPPFQWTMVFSALVYALLGLYYLRRLLLSFWFPRFIAQWVIVALLFGTNMLYYSAADVTASHVYSFFVIAAFAWYARHFFQKGRPRSFILATVAFGLTLLIRPVNGLVVLTLPFLAGNANLFKGQLRSLWSRTVVWIGGVVILVGIGMVQLIMYKVQTGYWMVWSYANEGFYFSNPSFWRFLFSFERGWFIYSPFFFLLIPAVVFLWKLDRWRAAWWTAFFLVTVYILSSWWSWHYGGSYGSRPMIDFYALLVLPIAWAASKVHFKHRNAFMAVIGLGCVLLTTLQVHQMNTGILSPWHMNASKYLWSIGKLDPQKHANQLGGRIDTPPYHKTKTVLYQGSLESHDGHWQAKHRGDQGQAVFDSEKEFNLGFNYAFSDTPEGKLLLQYSLDRISFSENAGTNAYLVIEVKDVEGENKLYDAFRLDDHPGMPLDETEHFDYQYNLGLDINQGDRLKVYIWNKGKGSFEVRDASASVVELK